MTPPSLRQSRNLFVVSPWLCEQVYAPLIQLLISELGYVGGFGRCNVPSVVYLNTQFPPHFRHLVLCVALTWSTVFSLFFTPSCMILIYNLSNSTPPTPVLVPSIYTFFGAISHPHFNSLRSLAYDWRLSPRRLEDRDGFYSACMVKTWHQNHSHATTSLMGRWLHSFICWMFTLFSCVVFASMSRVYLCVRFVYSIA